jgi:hypothetical protein
MRRGGAERVSPARASMAKHSTATIEILNVEIASALLACFVLDCCILLAEERRLLQPREDVIARLTAARQEARRLKRLLDPSDAASVHRILEHYLPRVPSQLPRS